MAEGFSILIPTHGRIQYLEKLAQSLQVAKDHFHFPSETIFIDDTPGSQQAQVQEIAARYHCRCLTDIHNVAAKRNKGIQEAQFDFILFIDSDCEATPDLLIEHWKSLHTSPEVGGCLGLLTFLGPEHWLWDVIRLTPFTVSFYWPLSRTYVPWGPTANISYRRDVLVQVGGCDETFPSQPGGEDVDMGLRVTKAGFHIVTNARAEVFHPNETWLGLCTALKRFYAWGRADHYLTVRHPDIVLLQFPRVILLTTMITLLCCILAIYWYSLWILILPFAWFLTTQILWAITAHMLSPRNKKSSIVMHFVSSFMTLSNEIGFLQEALKQQDWKGLFCGLRYQDVQEPEEYRRGVAQIICTSATLLLFFLLLLLWR